MHGNIERHSVIGFNFIVKVILDNDRTLLLVCMLYCKKICMHTSRHNVIDLWSWNLFEPILEKSWKFFFKKKDRTELCLATQKRRLPKFSDL